ncbi:MAG: cobyric acid synthase [Blautia sp.]|nr:cobyric acid synthase [Blautia sp.]
MAMRIMIQGTMSGVGKSLLTAALCRIFCLDGYRTVPFKSQNMALNSFITRDGYEMGRAQVLQAQAAGREPDCRMNPILLKPTGDTGSQVIVNGQVYGDFSAVDYFRMKKKLIPVIMDSFGSLAAENDIIVIEGAGSPAEINLKKDDIVNMGLAELVDAPVILAGDIDPGGVFAQIYGTIKLLPDNEQKRIVGTVINKFRGDVEILRPGLKMLEDLTGVPVLGVVPYLKLDLDDEDSLSPRLSGKHVGRPLDIAVIRLPRISNFTDFNPLEMHPLIGVRYVGTAGELGTPDLVILPGTKNTMEDLLWIRQNGLETAVKKLHDTGTPVLGICGGYQMLGESLYDPEGVEHGGEMRGMGLIPCRTVFSKQKIQTQTLNAAADGPFAGAVLNGYQVHMGQTYMVEKPDGQKETTDRRPEPLCHLSDGQKKTIGRKPEPFCHLQDGQPEGIIYGNVFGTYVHGLFDTGDLTSAMADWLMERKGITGMKDCESVKLRSRKEVLDEQLDILAETVRNSIDIDKIYQILRHCT